MRKSDIRKISTIVSATVISLMVAIGFAMFPPISDDVHFLMPYRDYMLERSGSLSDAYYEVVNNFIYHSNGRLANLIYALFAPFRWVLYAISALAVWGILVEGAKIGKFASRRLIFGVYAIGFLFCFPWVDQLYLIDFQTNYIWSTALALFIFRRFSEREHRRPTVLVTLCFVLGFWHEGTAACLLLAFLTIMVTDRRFRNWISGLCSFALLPGICFISSRQWGWTANYFDTRQAILYIYSMPAAVFAAMWFAAFFKGRQAREFVLSPIVLGLAAIASSATIFMLLVPTGPRTGSLGIICSIIGVCALLSADVVFKRIKIGRTTNTIILTALYALIFCHLSVVDYECYKAGKLNKIAVEEFQRNPCNTIYADMTLRTNAPFISAQKPYYDWFGHFLTVYSLSRFYSSNPEDIFMVVPTQLEQLDNALIEPIAGTAGLSRYKGLLIGPQVGDKPTVVNLHIIEFHRERTVQYYVVPITDNRRIAWYYPNRSNLFNDLTDKVVSIDFAGFVE